MDVDTFLKLANSGMGVVTLFILSQLWTEYKKQNDFIREMLIRLTAEQERAEMQRAAIAKTIGVHDSAMNIPVQK